MKRKISTHIFWAYWIIILAVAGSSALCYKVFFPLYYDWVKDKQIREACLDIEDLDLANLSEEDFSAFAEYEDENLSFTIADEDFNPIYATRDNHRYLVYRNIEMRLDSFSETPEVIKRDSKLRETTKMRVIITQNGVKYYVVIRDVLQRVGAAKISENFFVAATAFVLLLGSLLIRRFANDVSRPMEKVADVAERVAAGDFRAKADKEGRYEEICRLAESVNSMSEQLLQDWQRLEESRRQTLHQSVCQERADKLHKDFMANISHELKTPLAVISSQSEMIENADAEKRKYYLNSIQEEVEKIAGMVSRLLDISTVDHHMEGLMRKTLDMKEVMEYILMKYEGLVKKKHLHLEIFLEEGCLVYGDQEYIEQAVNNYMMNAIEHMEMGGNLRVTLKGRKTEIRVGVYNSGRQIPLEDMERIWSGFYTTKKKAADSFSHMGLGLYIVQNAITMQEGKCGVHNMPEGVEFWFTLPRA